VSLVGSMSAPVKTTETVEPTTSGADGFDEDVQDATLAISVRLKVPESEALAVSVAENEVVMLRLSWVVDRLALTDWETDAEIEVEKVKLELALCVRVPSVKEMDCVRV
jgi:hypothetical protein